MGPKSERVYRTIREWITTGKYLPGSKIPSERTLSEELDIGRTALRQVLAKLVAEGKIEVHVGITEPLRPVRRALAWPKPTSESVWAPRGDRPKGQGDRDCPALSPSMGWQDGVAR